MITVLIAGQKDPRLTCWLGECLAPFAQLSQKAVVKPPGPSPRFLLWETGCPQEIFLEQGILLFRENCQPPPECIIRGNCVAVACSQSPAVLELLEKLEVPVITCGLSTRDTVTYASNQEESLVVSFQRSFHTLLGELVEPMELPFLTPPPLGRMDLLLGCAALALAGEAKIIGKQ